MRRACLAASVLLTVACMPEPKTACHSSDDCVSGRVCMSGTCQSPARDAGLDRESDATPPEDRASDPTPELGPQVDLDAGQDQASPDVEPDAGPDQSRLEPPVEAGPEQWPQPVTDTGTDQASAAPDAAPDAPLSNDTSEDSVGLDRIPVEVGIGAVDVQSALDGGDASCGEAGCASTEWELIDGTPDSSPAAVRWASGENLDLFWRGSDRHLKHKRFSNHAWSEEQDLGGTLASDPCASARATDVVDVFWRGADDRLKHKWLGSAGDWSREEDLGGTLASAPTSVSWDPYALFVFWRGNDGKLKQTGMDYATTTWSGETDVGFQLKGDPGAMVRSYGAIDVFWRGADGGLEHIWSYDGQGWIGVQYLGGAIAPGSSPTATARRDGWADILWRGTDNRLKHVWLDLHSMWSAVEDLGGDLAGSPSAATTGTGRLDVFCKDALSGKIAHRVWTDNSANP